MWLNKLVKAKFTKHCCFNLIIEKSNDCSNNNDF